jgi:hypothetical protein
VDVGLGDEDRQTAAGGGEDMQARPVETGPCSRWGSGGESEHGSGRGTCGGDLWLGR